jgi:cytochrome c5
MNNKKALLLYSVTMLSTTFTLASPPVFGIEGEKLFQQHCNRCHQSPTDIKIPPEQISSVLKTGNIRQHRFTLDDDSIQAIIDYIKQKRA